MRGDFTVGWRGDATKQETTAISGVAGGKATYEYDVSALILMPNAYLDLGPFYVGVGAGLSRSSTGAITLWTNTGDRAVTNVSAETWGFAWQGSVGVNIPLTEKTFLDLGYRYFGLPIDFGRREIVAGSTELKLTGDYLDFSEFRAGFRYHF